jgi:hypothetical protein
LDLAAAEEVVRSATAGEAVLGEWMRQTLAVEVCEFA